MEAVGNGHENKPQIHEQMHANFFSAMWLEGVGVDYLIIIIIIIK